MVDLLAKHTGRTINEICEKLNNKDSWLAAQEAVDFGLADRICSYAEMLNLDDIGKR